METTTVQFVNRASIVIGNMWTVLNIENWSRITSSISISGNSVASSGAAMMKLWGWLLPLQGKKGWERKIKKLWKCNKFLSLTQKNLLSDFPANCGPRKEAIWIMGSAPTVWTVEMICCKFVATIDIYYLYFLKLLNWKDDQRYSNLFCHILSNRIILFLHFAFCSEWRNKKKTFNVLIEFSIIQIKTKTAKFIS